MNKHPNALVGGASGLSGGSIVVYLLSLVHVHPSLYVAGLIFTAASSITLFIGRNGFAGVWGFIKHGTGSSSPAAP